MRLAVLLRASPLLVAGGGLFEDGGSDVLRLSALLPASILSPTDAV